MHEIIEEFQKKMSLNDVFHIYGDENKEIIKEYVEFIIDNEYGFLCNYDEYDLFIDMDYNFDIPTSISNAVVEMSNENISNFQSIISELIKTNCKNLHLVFYEEVSVFLLIFLLKSSSNPIFNSIELVLKFSEELKMFVSEIGHYNPQISNIIFHSANENYKNEINDEILVTFINSSVSDFSYCGAINKYYFNVNKNKVLESINHNSCLHKKISIDKDGNIKNCPSMTESFGNIKDTTLEQALNHPNFKKYWNITKDQIEVCKDCEFRHICTDCRAYIENPEDQYSKPLKCGYNPYTNVWEEWSTNPLKQKAIEYYGMQELIKNNA